MRFVAIACALALVVPCAMGELIGPGIRIEVQQETGAVGSIEWSLTQDVDFSIPAAVEIRSSSGELLATIERLEARINGDPSVTLFFAVQAEASATLIIKSALLTFSPIVNPDAYVTVSVTVTDTNRDTATATGAFEGGKLFQARYNDGVVWATLVNTMSAPRGSSAIGEERRPAIADWETIPDTVWAIQSEYKFTLSALDSASGTSTFEIVPEPASLLLVALGGAFCLIRRRR